MFILIKFINKRSFILLTYFIGSVKVNFYERLMTIEIAKISFKCN